MDSEMKMMFNTIIEEMGNMEERINKRFDKRFEKIEKELESLHHEVNACKLERETKKRRLQVCHTMEIMQDCLQMKLYSN